MSTADGDGDLILHRWPRAWGLPSLSPECVAVEAYLRLAHLRFSAEDCRTPYASPSGTLPALDQCADVVGGVEGKDEHGQRDNHGAVAARRITTHLARKVANLDAHVRDASDRSALAAYLALVEARLARATAYFTWVDRDRFYAHTRREYGRAFPPPPRGAAARVAMAVSRPSGDARCILFSESSPPRTNGSQACDSSASPPP